MSILNPALREAEFRRCQRDGLHFLSEYWQVQRVGVGYGKFDLYDYQVEDAETFLAIHDYADHLLRWRNGEDEAPPPSKVRKLRQVRLKARQLGWTTLATGLVFWSAFFHDNHPWLIAAQGQEDASITMKQQVKAPFSRLPKWMRDRGPNVIQDGAEDFGFDNGSRIRVIPSTASSGRGDAMFGALLDEGAFPENAADLFAAVDPMCYGPLFLFSTANGMGNFFHETWEDSLLSDSEWEGAFRPWSDRPDRDIEWYEATKRKYRNKLYLFYQEYPSTPEEAFSKSGRLALPVERIAEVQEFVPPSWRFSTAKIIDGVQRGTFESWDDWDRLFQSALVSDDLLDQTGEAEELWVWHQPQTVRDVHGRLAYVPNYVVGADVSEALDNGDFMAISVIDANTQETVATMKSHTSLTTYDLLLEAIGYWYHTALIGPERNNHGMVPLVQLQLRQYPRLFRMDRLAQIKTADRSPRYGWHTGPATKPKMIADLAEQLGDGLVRLWDERFMAEARTYLSNGKGGYEASSGNHDDLIMATAVAVQLMLDVGQSPPIFYDPQPGPPTMGEVLQVQSVSSQVLEGVALTESIGQEKKAEHARKAWQFVPH